MKKAHKTALAILCLIASALLAVACAKDPAPETPGPDDPGTTTNPSTGDVTVAVPTEVKLTSSGELTWKNASGVTWQVSLDGENWTDVTKNKIDLLEDLVPAVGTATARVRAKSGDDVSDAATLSFTVEKLGVPGKPEKKEDPQTHQVTIGWTAPAGVTAFLYNINGSNSWVTLRATSFAPAVTGSYTVLVKSKGYAEPRDNKLWLNSDASESSGAIDFLAGVSISNSGLLIDEIAIKTEDEFDSYELYVRHSRFDEDFYKVEGNGNLVDLAEDGAINLVKSGFITATGEYDLIVKSTKGAEASWSNILTEWGTDNINENELYSWDNRMPRPKNPSSPPAGSFEITSEQAHKAGTDSESDPVGYSAKVTGGGPNQQIAFSRYGSGEIDFRFIRKISYWVYIPAQSGLDGPVTASYANLPMFRWETQIGEDYPGMTSNVPSVQIPLDTWTKIEQPVANAYEDVLIFVFPRAFTYYIDNVSYDTAEPTDDYVDVSETPGFEGLEEGTDFYRLSLDRIAIVSSSWMGYIRTKIDLGSSNAGKTVWLTAEVTGNAPEHAVMRTAGIMVSPHRYYQANDSRFQNDAGGNRQILPIEQISKLGTWSTVALSAVVGDDGCVWMSATRITDERIKVPETDKDQNGWIDEADLDAWGEGRTASIDTEYAIFIKNIQVLGEASAAGENGLHVIPYKLGAASGAWEGDHWEHLLNFDADKIGTQAKLTFTVGGTIPVSEHVSSGCGLALSSEASNAAGKLLARWGSMSVTDESVAKDTLFRQQDKKTFSVTVTVPEGGQLWAGFSVPINVGPMVPSGLDHYRWTEGAALIIRSVEVEYLS